MFTNSRQLEHSLQQRIQRFDVDMRPNDRVDFVDDELHLKILADHLRVELNGLLFSATLHEVRPEQLGVKTLSRLNRFGGVKLLELVKGDAVQRLRAEENDEQKQFHHQRIVENERNETVRQVLISAVKVRVVAAADRLDGRGADLRSRRRLQNGVIQRQQRPQILLDQLHLIVDGQKLQFGQMFQIRDQMDDDRFLSVVEVVQSKGEQSGRRRVTVQRRFTGVLIVALVDVVQPVSMIGTEIKLRRRASGMNECGDERFLRSPATSIHVRLKTFFVFFLFAADPFFLHSELKTFLDSTKRTVTTTFHRHRTIPSEATV